MPHLQTLRTRAAMRQHFRCIYCRLPVWTGDPQPLMRQFQLTPKEARSLQCTAEHLTARCDGGTDSADNIAAACLHCNRTRHLRAKPLDLTAYQALVQRRLGRGGWHTATITAKVGAALKKLPIQAGRPMASG